MKDFIKQQQELAKGAAAYAHPDTRDMVEGAIQAVIATVISNTGEELMRLAEGERKDEVKWKKAKYDVKSVEAVCYNRGIDTMKQHITSLTGVE